MARELSDALAVAHETSEMVLLRSIGPDFCTGRLRDPDAGPPHPEAYSRRPEYDSIFYCYQAIRDAQVPVVGVIEGRCMGFGTAAAACCDVSFASSNARFNIPEMTHQVMPTMVMSALYDRMNRNAIMWMTYSAEFIDAQQAMMYGIVSRAVDADKLEDEVASVCETLLSRPRPGILGLKEYLRSAPHMDLAGRTSTTRAAYTR